MTCSRYVPIVIGDPGHLRSRTVLEVDALTDSEAHDEAWRWIVNGQPRTPQDVLDLLEPLWGRWGSLDREAFADALLARLAH